MRPLQDRTVRLRGNWPACNCGKPGGVLQSAGKGRAAGWRRDSGGIRAIGRRRGWKPRYGGRFLAVWRRNIKRWLKIGLVHGFFEVFAVLKAVLGYKRGKNHAQVRFSAKKSPNSPKDSSMLHPGDPGDPGRPLLSYGSGSSGIACNPLP